GSSCTLSLFSFLFFFTNAESLNNRGDKKTEEGRTGAEEASRVRAEQAEQSSPLGRRRRVAVRVRTAALSRDDGGARAQAAARAATPLRRWPEGGREWRWLHR